MVNSVIIVGHIGKDPEVKEVSEGVKVATFFVAVNKTFKKPNEEKQERTDWIPVKAWRKTAEIIESYGKKGQLVSIEGELETSNWEEEGKKRYSMEVVANKFKILSKKEE